MNKENQVINGNADSKLVESRLALIKIASSTGEKIQTYASNLCSVFNLVDADGEIVKHWFDLAGKERQGLKFERDEFVKGMEEAGYKKGTIDVYWQRIKEASGYITAGNRVTGNQSVDEKTVAELMTIINRIFKAEEEGQETRASEFKRNLMDVYHDLGGNMDKLG